MLYSSPSFKISAFCKQWAICSQGLQAKKYSNLLQNRSPNSTHKPKPPTWYSAVMPTCRAEIGPEQGDLQKNLRLCASTHGREIEAVADWGWSQDTYAEKSA